VDLFGVNVLARLEALGPAIFLPLAGLAALALAAFLTARLPVVADFLESALAFAVAL
jgi:hypothetical protein